MDPKSLQSVSTSQLSVRSRRSSIDSAASTSSKLHRGRDRLSRLIPDSIRDSLRRSKNESPPPPIRAAQPDHNQSDIKLNLDDDLVEPENVITVGDDGLEEEEDDESLTRPSLSPHQSHTGFLTLSSPRIRAATIDTSPSLVEPSSIKAANIPTKADTLSTPPPSARRSPSPVGRLREAFVPSKRGTNTSAIGGDAEGTKPGGVGAEQRGIGKIFAGRSRKESDSKGPTTFDTPVRLLDDLPLVQEPGEKTPSPKKFAPKPILTTPATPPRTANGPTTFVTPPTPVESDAESGSEIAQAKRAQSPAPPKSQPAVSIVEAAGHRRTRSALAPSKLSQSISRPITPAEEFPASDNVPGQGFFSSVLSAAQNAANSLSNSISVGPSQKSKSIADSSEHLDASGAGGEEVITPFSKDVNFETAPERKPAVDTLGSGNLSLSHLGILDKDNISPMSSRVNLVEVTPNGANAEADEASAKRDDTAASRAVSKAYTVDKTNGEKQPSPELIRNGAGDENSPIRQSIEPESASIKRAGSVRSKISAGRRRRTRGSSANTQSGLAPPGLVARPTNWAPAPIKRNKDFHNLFKSVPEDDLLIEDYSAALQKDILLQGRIYVSEGHICFYSNIIGFVNTLVMSFDEVISVEKKSTAMIFQNGIVVQTLHARNSFASLLNRDSTYELIVSIWRTSQPNLRSSINGNLIDGPGTGDKTEKAGSVADDESASEEIYDEDLEDDDDDDHDDDDDRSDSFVEAHDDGYAQSGAVPVEPADATSRAVLGRKVSAQVGSALAASSSKQSEAAEAAVSGGSTLADYPGPAAHDPTDCGDQASHCEKPLLDATIPAPLGKVYSLMFGPMSGNFMRKWLTEEQKCYDLQLEDDRRGMDGAHKELAYQYVKPLGGSIGPKQTRCIINATMEQFDLEKAVTVMCSTQNPDVPSGNVFVVKTRYCLMWGPSNSTRLVMTYVIEWSGKSWIKGPIENGARDGQTQYAKDLAAALRAAVTKSATNRSGKSRAKGGVRRRKGTADGALDSSSSPTPASAATSSSSGGAFEILTSLPQGLLAGLLGILLLIVLWRGRTPRGDYGVLPAHRIAAYEEMWRAEEAELWQWLEERVGERAWMGHAPSSGSVKKVEPLRMFDQLDKMGEQQVGEAIRITKEKLGVLEDALREKKGRESSSLAEGKAEL
ncbi:hypothetical protein BT63DRAFT_449354 [Microthyrium microscopicum]|uniref:VASt domain-containing protein n=1 Tax=Microthyrium microscopicum TaxID=703497 RepID=A0A6A6USK0_9PEZI|nr:hypothetical protein BT63DRAFT_449354 [Microthyrium microscopicum]